MHDSPATAVVLVPVKSFDRAKARLSDSLSAEGRAGLAREMAEVVLAAASPLGVVVACDDEEVAAWARERGAAVAWTPGTDLNGALAAAVGRVRDAGVSRVVIAHADLPFASDLPRFARASTDEVLAVADRHGEGTNVMSVPTSPFPELRYGPGSLAAHRAAALAAGLRFREVEDPALAWDVDEPSDLHPPAGLGSLPGAARA